MNTGMGVSAFSWSEIQSYSQQSGMELTGWESQQLVSMSREYSVWIHKAKDPKIESPWHCYEYNYQIALEENRKRVIEGMMKQRAQRRSGITKTA